MTTKICAKCGQEKLTTDFGNKKDTRDGLYRWCKQCTNRRKREWHTINKNYANYKARERRKTNYKYHNDKNNEWNASIKNRAYTALGGKCACCGETEASFLQIDHINNDGAKHRKELKSGMYAKLYTQILNNTCEYKLQLLCANCHHSKTLLGQCIHQTKK